jgi:Ca2+/Na+ antiporter
MVGDKFWSEDISVLYSASRASEFFPTQSMTKEEQLNAITRFFMYFSLTTALYKREVSFLGLLLVGFALTYYIYVMKISIMPEEKALEKYTQPVYQDTNCTVPSEENPFMNVVVTDYGTGKDPLPACDVNNPEVKKEMNKMFEKNLPVDANDYFYNKHSQRAFFSNPSTTIPNDQLNFGKWLFSQQESCKDTNNCEVNDDLRFNSSASDLLVQAQKLDTRVIPYGLQY